MYSSGTLRRLLLFEFGGITSVVAEIGKRQHRMAGTSEIASGSLIGIAAPGTAKHQEARPSRSAGHDIEMPDQAALAHVHALDVLRLRGMAGTKSENQENR
jgi:hypothetical protein